MQPRDDDEIVTLSVSWNLALLHEARAKLAAAHIESIVVHEGLRGLPHGNAPGELQVFKSDYNAARQSVGVDLTGPPRDPHAGPDPRCPACGSLDLDQRSLWTIVYLFRLFIGFRGPNRRSGRWCCRDCGHCW